MREREKEGGRGERRRESDSQNGAEEERGVQMRRSRGPLECRRDSYPTAAKMACRVGETEEGPAVPEQCWYPRFSGVEGVGTSVTASQPNRICRLGTGLKLDRQQTLSRPSASQTFLILPSLVVLL